jgi:hypothetical protein
LSRSLLYGRDTLTHARAPGVSADYSEGWWRRKRGLG